ncbi:N-acetylneuraminate synthase family protein [uncultured Desulfobacter sp.]|uniref:N-acetylneuraminate synthase family protein n=1 Tax=uncultured Desulfobacter sp. TaxID=240139 RepID=UPI0029F52AE7|nr:N-acetylneuraminate synthase family protein [uncultured Desulfobacter sp.]
MENYFEISGRPIGNDYPAYIVCEIGINHEGDFNLARNMVKAAAQTGADSVKFQWERPASKVIEGDVEHDELTRQFFSIEQLAELFSLANANDMACSAVIADHRDLKYVRKLGADYFKIESDDLTYLDLISDVGESGAALMLSTGVATLEQVSAAVQAFLDTGNERLVLLHTVSAYPTPDDQVQLDIIEIYKKAFECMVGYCDHTEDDLAVLAAASRGVHVIEKHFTLDRRAKGSDWEVSLEPEAFSQLVRNIRRIERMGGQGVKRIFEPEKGKERLIRRSIVAARDIQQGEILTRENIALKKPGSGLGPELLPLFLGKPCKRQILKEAFIREDMV